MLRRTLVVDGPWAGEVFDIPHDASHWMVFPPTKPVVFDLSMTYQVEMPTPLHYRVARYYLPESPALTCPWCKRDHSTWLPRVKDRPPVLPSAEAEYRALVLSWPPPGLDTLESQAAKDRWQLGDLPVEVRRPLPCPLCPTSVRVAYQLSGRPLRDPEIVAFVIEFIRAAEARA